MVDGLDCQRADQLGALTAPLLVEQTAAQWDGLQVEMLVRISAEMKGYWTDAYLVG